MASEGMTTEYFPTAIAWSLMSSVTHLVCPDSSSNRRARAGARKSDARARVTK